MMGAPWVQERASARRIAISARAALRRLMSWSRRPYVKQVRVLWLHPFVTYCNSDVRARSGDPANQCLECSCRVPGGCRDAAESGSPGLHASATGRRGRRWLRRCRAADRPTPRAARRDRTGRRSAGRGRRGRPRSGCPPRSQSLVLGIDDGDQRAGGVADKDVWLETPELGARPGDRAQEMRALALGRAVLRVGGPEGAASAVHQEELPELGDVVEHAGGIGAAGRRQMPRRRAISWESKATDSKPS